MSGRILIVETTASQRILLRGQLESAHYATQPIADLGEAMAIITANPPALVLLDIGAEPPAALALCAALRDSPATAALPVIAFACQPGPEARLAALRAGADDVLDKRGSPAFLLARIRSLLRVRDPAAEFAIGGDTARALGMAEAAQGFVPAGRTAIVTRRPAALPPALAALAARLPGGTIIVDPAADVTFGAAVQGDTALTDLFIIDHAGPGSGDPGDASALFRLIADLQSRRSTRLAKTLVLVPQAATTLAEMALDLGADDLVTDATGTEEVAFRVRALLRRKNMADRRRDRLQSGIEAALTDPLTGLHNRRYAMAELATLAEAGTGFAVILLDIDHFKRVNDTFGHAAGDLVLRSVADLLRANLRATDLVARIGGEEFLVVMPQTPVCQAQSAAERLRRVVQDAPIALTPVQPNGTAVHVTLSAGVAAGDGAVAPADAVAPLLDRADRALYAAKSAGRNMVTVDRTAA